jgi:hypothetical protein
MCVYICSVIDREKAKSAHHPSKIVNTRSHFPTSQILCDCAQIMSQSETGRPGLGVHMEIALY